VSKDFDRTLSDALDLAAGAAQTAGAQAARVRGRKRTMRKRVAISTMSFVLVLAAAGATAAFKPFSSGDASPPAVAGSVSASPSAAAITSAPAAPTTAPGTGPSAPPTSIVGCTSASGSDPGSLITVCPGAAPVGAVVHLTIKNCGGGLPDVAAADLHFLGPASWLGTDGGGGATVPFAPRSGSTEATATFTIPATYTGGNENLSSDSAYPTVETTPGTGYTFTTNPAGGCNVDFTVTAS
jgi:hypothetical protein